MAKHQLAYETLNTECLHCMCSPSLFLNNDNSNININSLNQMCEIAKGPVFQQVFCFCRERLAPWSTQQLHVLVSPHFSDSSQRLSQTNTWYSPSVQCPASHSKAHMPFHFHFRTLQKPHHLILVAKTNRCNSKQSCPTWKSFTLRFFF